MAMMNVVLLTSDLMVVSRVAGAVARLRGTLETVSTADRAVASCERRIVPMAIVDLNTPGLKPKELVDRLASVAPGRPTIVAFGPHVHEALLTAARDAGCDEVVSRGEFFAHLDAILQRLAT
jgi:DNA-binding NarL/FixJ family response regulator